MIDQIHINGHEDTATGTHQYIGSLHCSCNFTCTMEYIRLTGKDPDNLAREHIEQEIIEEVREWLARIDNKDIVQGGKEK